MMELLSQYLGVEAHPAAVQGVLAEPRGSTHVVLPRGGVDHLQGLVTHRPVHTEVGRLARLPGLRVADSWRREENDAGQETVWRKTRIPCMIQELLEEIFAS